MYSSMESKANNEKADNIVKVSVIMAVHKGVNSTHLDLAIDSVLNQTMDDFELVIVCDGGLTDEQALIISTAQDADDRVVVLHLQKNSGPGAARNAGIAIARGMYSAIMDSDDVAMPYRLERQSHYLDKHENISVVGGFCNVVDDNGNLTGVRKLPLSPDSLRRFSLFFCPLNNPTVMGRTRVFREYKYDEEFRQGEDYILWVNLLKNNHALANMSDILLDFRVSADLYKRRSGMHKAKSDFVNRMYAVRIAPIYYMPLVMMFAVGMFFVRFLPSGMIRFLTSRLEVVRARLIR